MHLSPGMSAMWRESTCISLMRADHLLQDLGKGKGCPWGDEVQYVIVAPDRGRISYRVSLFGLQAGAEWNLVCGVAT